MPGRPASSYRYALRVCIAPGFFVREKLEKVLAFCRKGGVGEVILFANYEELNRGHITPQEQEEWLDVYRQAQGVLGPAGITLSLNPWETLLHGDRGRRLRPGQNFRLMVDPEGVQASACVCPLDEPWRAHLAATYARYAAVHPHVLWIEDDFRFHNHAPLTWGGCFCEEHLRVLGERHGARVTRNELVATLTAPGEPHPLRFAWLDLNGETLVEVARLIAAAVKRVSPETRLGLMTSVPSTHCAEGRRWEELIDALGGPDEAVVRPHLPAYRETVPGQYLWRTTIPRQTVALLPAQTTVLPELDNGPHSLFTKSRALTRFQIALAATLDGAGITMNILDPTGNGPLLEEGYQTTLRGLRPFVDRTLALGLHRDQLVGLTVPFSPRASYHLHTDDRYRAGGPRYDLQAPGGRLESLYPDEGKWVGLLTCYGFGTVVTAEQDFVGQTLAISGQWLRNLPREQCLKLLMDNAVLLDGAAALTACDLGLAGLLGIARVRDIVPQDTGRVAYEEVADGTVLLGNARARFSAQGSTGPAVIFDYGPHAQPVTQLHDFTGAVTGPGLVFGTPRALILPYVFADSPDTCLLSTLRKQLFLTLLPRLAAHAAQVSAIADHAYLTVYRYDRPEDTMLLLVNASTDEAASPTLFLGDRPDGPAEAEVCDLSGQTSRVALAFRSHRASLPLTLPPMSLAALHLPPPSHPPSA